MRREGRPHGMVRTYHVLPAPMNPKPPSRIVNPLNMPPTAGLFTKVSNKPTNHSKFTGKCEKVRCAGCHLHPARKAKDKSKGALKHKTSEAALDYHQVTWRVLGPNKLRNNGYSASGILDELNIQYHHHHNFLHDDDDDHNDDVYDDDDDDDVGEHVVDSSSAILVENVHNPIVVDDDVNDDDVKDDDEMIIHVGVTDNGDDGYVGFYDVAYVMNSVDEDGWAIVGGDQIGSC